MVPQDSDAVVAFLSNRRLSSIRTILLISPNGVQYRQFRDAFPQARVYCSDRHSWNLSQKKSWQFDLIFASNVFMYSPDPPLWFDHVLACCRLFLVQDLINRRRSNTSPFLGPDQDAIRYEYRERGVQSEFPGAFDLGALSDRCECFEAYVAENLGNRHFIALYRGRVGETPAALGLGSRIALARAKFTFVLKRVKAFLLGHSG